MFISMVIITFIMVISSFKNFLINDSGARKVFGEKEIGIMLNQIEGKTLSQSEKNRLSRDIRPKLKFIGECSAFVEFFRLEKNIANKLIIDDSTRKILNDSLSAKISSILLFGSFADGTFNKNSDIDIAVVFEEGVPYKEASLFRKRLMADLNGKVDLQVFEQMPLKIKKGIAKNHKILFKSKSFDNTNFIMKNINKYQEMNFRAKKLAL